MWEIPEFNVNALLRSLSIGYTFRDAQVAKLVDLPAGRQARTPSSNICSPSMSSTALNENICMWD